MSRPRRKQPTSLQAFFIDIRTQLGMTQQQFAHRLNVAVTTVARWESASGRSADFKHCHRILALRECQERPVLAARIKSWADKLLWL